jgi:GNAT superfamily N-acetyltransferase
MPVQIARAARDFSDWAGVLQLLRDAFAFMEERIDPPSSVHRLTPTSIAAKSREETLFLATDEDELLGCVFASQRSESLYVSKLGVRRDRQGEGIGRRLMEAVEHHAHEVGIRNLELDTRIELTENQETFAAMGYVRTAEHAHDGYDQPTFVTMRKELTDVAGR